MGAIDWARAAMIGGKGVEDFIATLLCRRYPDARQINPGQGDGGIDVIREMVDGIEIWQIKKFTARLTAGQKTQVAASWAQFWKKNVEAGRMVKSYALVTPWTPTESYIAWFHELTAEATFPVKWEGEAFIDGLIAEFAGVAELFFEPGAFDKMVTAKAVLAASPIEVGPPATMFKAIEVREMHLREIRDDLHPHYYMDYGTRTSNIPGQPPRIDPTEAGVWHEYAHIEGDRWRVMSLVPKHPDAPPLDPRKLTVSFTVEKGSTEEAKLLDFLHWGIPLEGLRGVSQQIGGPFPEREPSPGLIAFQPAASPDDVPDMLIRAPCPDGTWREVARLRVVERTVGSLGGGIRLVARTTNQTMQVEIRTFSKVTTSQIRVTVMPEGGQDPRVVLDDLRWAAALTTEHELEFWIEGVGRLAKLDNMAMPQVGDWILPVAADLIRLQPHTSETLLMPHMPPVLLSEVENLHQLADVFDGHAVERTWEKLELTVIKDWELPEGLLDGTKMLALVEQPVFTLGESEYMITRQMATQFLHVALEPGVKTSQIKEGDVVHLVPGESDRVVVAAVVDSRP